ncbi:MAG: hypothetical protein ACRDB0_05170 [Paraclostridium sp.]
MSKKIAYSGILLSVNIILLLMTNIIPMNTMFLMGLASLPVSIIIMEYKIKTGIVFYIASVILSFIIIQNKVQWVMYVFTFGIYGLIKYFIEKGRPVCVELLLKLCFANAVIIVLCILLKTLVIIPINIITILGFQLVFVIYDYVYSLFIDYYNEKLKKIINIK